MAGRATSALSVPPGFAIARIWLLHFDEVTGLDGVAVGDAPGAQVGDELFAGQGRELPADLVGRGVGVVVELLTYLHPVGAPPLGEDVQPLANEFGPGAQLLGHLLDRRLLKRHPLIVPILKDLVQRSIDRCHERLLPAVVLLNFAGPSTVIRAADRAGAYFDPAGYGTPAFFADPEGPYSSAARRRGCNRVCADHL